MAAVVGRDCASPEDEPNPLFELHGRNEVPFVRVWGWSHKIALDFPGLNPTLKMTEKIFAPDEIEDHQPILFREVEEEYYQQDAKRVRPLAEYVSKQDVRQYKALGFGNPLILQVVAKKKPEFYFKKENLGDAGFQVGVIGQLMVADESGLCVLTLFNECVKIIQHSVEVGDYLYIQTIGKLQFRHNDWKRQPYPFPFLNFFTNLELKIDKYSVRKIVHIPWKKQKSWRPTLNSELFRTEVSKLWMPGEVLSTHLEGKRDAGADKQVYLDVTGVVSYVGRMERSMINENYIKFQNPVNNKREVQMFRCFEVYRWITIIDKEFEELTVKLVINKDNLKVQKSIVPGAMIVLTNCYVDEYLRAEKYISADVFTQIYMNKDIWNYARLMPCEFREREGAFLNRLTYTNMLTTYKKWGAGGSVIRRIQDPSVLYARYMEWIQTPAIHRDSSPFFKDQVPSAYKLARRERYTLTIRGKILLVQGCTEENCREHTVVIVNADGTTARISTCPILIGDPEQYYTVARPASLVDRAYIHPHPCLCSQCQLNHWFYYARNFTPEPDQLQQWIAGTQNTRELSERVKQYGEQFCGCLLMPAQYSADADTDDNNPLPEFAELPHLHTFDHFRVHIYDVENRHCYVAKWSTFPQNEMRRRLLDAKDQLIIAVISFFRAERNCGNELVLTDFLIENDIIEKQKHLEEEITDRNLMEAAMAASFDLRRNAIKIEVRDDSEVVDDFVGQELLERVDSQVVVVGASPLSPPPQNMNTKPVKDGRNIAKILGMGMGGSPTSPSESLDINCSMEVGFLSRAPSLSLSQVSSTFTDTASTKVNLDSTSDREEDLSADEESLNLTRVLKLSNNQRQPTPASPNFKLRLENMKTEDDSSMYALTEDEEEENYETGRESGEEEDPLSKPKKRKSCEVF